jgi:hypothetical protein
MLRVFTPIISGMYQKGAIREGVISKEGKEAQLENKTWANSHHHRSPDPPGSP